MVERISGSMNVAHTSERVSYTGCRLGEVLWTNPQHLPILIHKPNQLADILPEAEKFERADHHAFTIRF